MRLTRPPDKVINHTVAVLERKPALNLVYGEVRSHLPAIPGELERLDVCFERDRRVRFSIFYFSGPGLPQPFCYLRGFSQGQGALRPEDLSKGVDCEVGQLTEFVEDPFSAMAAGFEPEEGEMRVLTDPEVNSGAAEMSYL